MAKMQARLATQGAKRGSGPIAVETTVSNTRTHEGAPGYTRDAKSELFLLAVSNFVSEDTFYEKAEQRDARFESLVHQVTREDPEWMQHFIPWLRQGALMRSASVVAAAEYAAARGVNSRQVIANTLARADEPAELLAYWLAVHGRDIPAAVKRGLADAARKFYTERNVLKYDSDGNSVRMADLLQLTHPKPRDEQQSALFKFLLTQRYNGEVVTDNLPMLAQNRALRQMDRAEARALLLSDPEKLAAAGLTWESLSSFGEMDKAAWEAMIPNMGYMALLRNLRNFDKVGVSDKVAKTVADKLADPEEVARSRQLPFRFWSAYKNAPSLRWSWALEQALDAATSNVPEFDGTTLILVDTSASMTCSHFSAKSDMTADVAAAVFGAVLLKKNPQSKLVGFASGSFTHNAKAGESALSIAKRFIDRNGEVGHGTNLAGALRQYKGENRIVVISDMQTRTMVTRNGLKPNTPVYGFNLGGYRPAAFTAGANNFYEFGGMTDKTFQMIDLIEKSKRAGWPWE